MSDTSLEVMVSGQRQKLLVSHANAELSLATLLRRAGVCLNTRCGERGLCEGCLVEPAEGRLVNIVSDADVDARYAGLVRACQYRVRVGTSSTLVVPARSLLGGRASAVSDFSSARPHPIAPVWRQVESHPGQWKTEEFLDTGWTVTAQGGRLISRPLGLAIDVGTTTVVVLLIELGSGEVLARAADFNQQMHFGDDVLTRITLCSNPAMIDELRRAVIDRTILPLAQRCIAMAQVDASDVVCATVAGNTTMLHLVAGIDPTPLGVVPFEPAFLSHRVLRGDLLGPWGLASGLALTMHLLPGSSAYVGSDLAAGLISSALIDDEGPSLLVDVGTNGEMILKHGKQLVGCATAAGPAFEGSGLSCGMRAGDGAIDHVHLTRDPFSIDVHVIGEIKPIGFCGSFYVDFLAEARRIGLIDEHGRYSVDQISAAQPMLSATECHGLALCVARGLGGRNLVVTEADIASLLTAKASIAAGLETLLARSSITAREARHVYLAGGFGTKLSLPSAIAMGLLPGFQIEQVRLVGNAALAGAWLSLLDAGTLARISEAATRVNVIELNQDPDFEERYINHLRLAAAHG